MAVCGSSRMTAGCHVSCFPFPASEAPDRRSSAMKGRPTGRARRAAALCQATLRGCGKKGRSRRNRAYTSFRPGARPDSLAALLSEATDKRPVRPRRRTARCCWTRSFYLPGNADLRALQQSLPLSRRRVRFARDLRRLPSACWRSRWRRSSPAWWPMPGALLVLLLPFCCGAVCARRGADRGDFGARRCGRRRLRGQAVAPVLGLTIAAAPLAPGAQAPGPRRPPLAPARAPGRGDPPRGRGRWLGRALACARAAAGLLEIRWKLRSAATSLTSCWDDETRFRVSRFFPPDPSRPACPRARC